MSKARDLKPDAAAIAGLLAALNAPGARYRLRDLPGAYSNFTHLLELDAGEAPPRKIVIRRYNPAHDEDGHDKPQCEYRALTLLQAQGIPVPAPLLLDASGALLGLPGIVTEFVSGAQIEPPTEAGRWGEMAAANALMLARIHQTPLREADKRFLMDDDVEVAWFIKSGRIPEYMRADADGEMVWKLVARHWRRWQPLPARLAHTDYWSGNILWRGDTITAVLDWEEAGYGHPAADVAYARLEYFLEGLPEAAATFLRVYEAAMGAPLPDLALFELAASARVMTNPRGWFTRPHMETRYRRFIAGAKARLLAGG